VTKGLFTVFGGYVIGMLNVCGIVALLWYTTDEFKKSIDQVSGNPFTVLLLGGAVSFFASLISSYLLIRGKWRCVVNAPEQRGAKWLMFASVVCICSGPALHLASGFAKAATVTQKTDEVEIKPGLERSMIRYVEELRENDSAAYLRLMGCVITPLGPIFFVLFLRAIHRCLGNIAAARVSELYLLFIVLLAVGSLSLLFDPSVKVRFDLLAILGIAWLVGMAWFFLLILSAVFGISAHLNAPRPPAEPL
jgi:hypothetical protein